VSRRHRVLVLDGETEFIRGDYAQAGTVSTVKAELACQDFQPAWSLREGHVSFLNRIILLTHRT
jgi:hypothetical protein